MITKKRLRGLLQLLFSVAILVWLVWRTGPAEIIATITNLDTTWLAVALILFIANIIIRAYRWYIILHALNAAPPFRYLIYLYFVSFFYNNFLPSGFGGDVVKVLSLRNSYGGGIDAASSVFMDRLIGLIGTALLGLLALGWYGLTDPTAVSAIPPLFIAITAAIGIIVPLGFILLRFIDPLTLISRLLPFLRRFTDHPKVRHLVDTIRLYPLPILWRAFLATLPFAISLITIHYAIARALGIDLPFAVFSMFVPIISVVTLLPISFNGLGVREGTYRILYEPLGVVSASAIAMSLVLHLIRFTTGLIGGLLYAWRGARTIQDTAVPDQP